MIKVSEIVETLTSPQVGVPVGAGPGGLSWLGVALPDWLTLFSLIYVIFLLAYGVWKWVREYKGNKNDKT